MRKAIILAFAFLFALFTLTISSCREQTTGEKIKDGVEEVGEDIKDGIKETGDEMEDAVEDN